MKIAPYLATNVQRSYLRQQRIGERIAELKGGSEPQGPGPAAQVDIPESVLATSRTARSDLARVRDEQLEQLTGRFAEKFAAAFFQPESGQAPEAGEAPGQPSFRKILDQLDLQVEEDPEGGGGLLIRSRGGQPLVAIDPKTREEALEAVRKLARDIFQQLI
ncbi:MAG: hypothetical protein AABZ64_08005 [Nitrospinota bacterium]